MPWNHNKTVMGFNMCRILISGYYGFDNAGDEAILQSLVTELKRAYSDIDIMVLSANPSKTSHDFNVRSVSRTNIVKLIRAVKNSDILISGGGSLFQDTTSYLNVWYYGGIIMLAFAMKKRVFAFAQGIGPVRSGINKKMLRFIFNRVQNISVRDIRSMRQLKTIGVDRDVSCTIDPAFLNDFITKDESLALLKTEIEKSTRKISSEDIEASTGKDEKAAYHEFKKAEPSLNTEPGMAPGVQVVTADERRRIAEKYGISIQDNDIIAAIFARLDPVKNVASFVNAAGIIASRMPEVKFLVCGNGPERNMLEHLAAKLGITSNIYFLGYVRPASEIMNIMDINVLTSLSESFPYSILEGAVLGKATVSSRVGGIPDLIENGVNGFLFEPGDDRGLAEHIITLASDTGLRKEMGKKLYEKVRSSFSLESMCRTQLGIYESILGCKP